MGYNDTVEDIYRGGYSSLDPNSGDLYGGYRTDIKTIGSSTDARTANIIKQVSDQLSPGTKVVELSLIQPDVFEAIPKQHLEEVKRISKLTGVDVTVHGPLIDASGATQQAFDDQQREIAEKKILHAVERSHEINPEGNIPVTFHTANALPGARYSKKDGVEQKEFMPVVNQETGRIEQIKREEKYYPDRDLSKPEEYSVEEQLNTVNNTEWQNSIREIAARNEDAERIMREIAPLRPLFMNVHERVQSGEIRIEDLPPSQREAIETYEKRAFNAGQQLSDSEAHMTALFSKAYKHGSRQEKEYLKGVSEFFKRQIPEKRDMSFEEKANAIQGVTQALGNIKPKIFKPAEEYAIEKSNETFGNVAWKAYKKFGSKAPIISLENPPAGMGLSRGKDVKEMVEGAREQFVNNAVKEGKLSKDQAEREAEKLIGVTWDVGHINQLRQFGFSGKDIIKEAEEVKPLVKHMHLSDNFGMENTELPMGMGNVDLKEVMKTLGEKGEKSKKIVEAFHWWQHHSDQGKTSPVGPTFEAVGSPLYSTGFEAPYWNQVAGLQPGYFSGYGQTFPQINYETFGAGFSNLPPELGGQSPGGQGGRMSGRGME